MACFTCRPALSSVCIGANGAVKELKNDASPRERRVNGVSQPKDILGWREWVALPDFGVGAIKAKVDTGARTSALHAYRVDEFEERGVRMVRFAVHPYQRRNDVEIACLAAVADERLVSVTTVQVGEARRAIEVTLANRDNMGLRMLLGRSALQGHYLVDADGSYISRPRPRVPRRPPAPPAGVQP